MNGDFHILRRCYLDFLVDIMEFFLPVSYRNTRFIVFGLPGIIDMMVKLFISQCEGSQSEISVLLLIDGLTDKSMLGLLPYHSVMRALNCHETALAFHCFPFTTDQTNILVNKHVYFKQ